MNSEKYATDLWQRTEEALRTAEADLAVSFDAAHRERTMQLFMPYRLCSPWKEEDL